jgi:hypothetical protein
MTLSAVAVVTYSVAFVVGGAWVFWQTFKWKD